MTVGVQVFDQDGHPLAQDARVPSHNICTGHGFGPRPIEKGKLIPIERTLAGEGWMPKNPGTYTVKVRWAPCTGRMVHSQPFAQDLKTYAELEATATFHVVGDKAVAENVRTK
jgi:hypothetical protein